MGAFVSVSKRATVFVGPRICCQRYPHVGVTAHYLQYGRNYISAPDMRLWVWERGTGRGQGDEGIGGL